MEEADILADSIAIMADGQLAAHGTSLDLKSRFGVGYTLTVSMVSSAAIMCTCMRSFVHMGEREPSRPEAIGVCNYHLV